MNNIKIFDKNGDLFESSFIFFEKVSTYLFSSIELHFMEEVYSLVENRLAFRKPLQEGLNIISFKFKIRKDVSKFFFVDVNDSFLIKRNYTIQDLDFVSYTLNIDGFKETLSQNKYPNSLFISFESEEEDNYTDFLDIYEVNSIGEETLFLSVSLFGTSEANNEKYDILLKNFGSSINYSDYLAFFESNPNEPISDNVLLNVKKKELLINLHDILPFIGSYKGLITILKFFGYNNLRLKEFWKNIDTNSPKYNTLKAIEISSNIFDRGGSFNDSSRNSLSKIYRKTNRFGLYFDIIVEDSEIGEDDLPLTKEVFSFSFKEIFFKILSLKNKLEKDFLSLNSRIVDIVGEAIYFGKISSKNWNHSCKISSYNLNIHPSCEILPSNNVFVEDLRPLQEIGCPIGYDLRLDNTSNLLHHRLKVIQYADSRILSRYKLTITVGLISDYIEVNFNTISERSKYIFTEMEVALKIVEFCKANTSTLFKNHRFFVEPSTAIIRIVQKYPYGVSSIVDEYEDVNLGLTIWADTIFPQGLNIDTSPGSSYFGVNGAPLSYYSSAFLFSFQSADIFSGFEDVPNIPIGARIILKNTSFEVRVEDLDDLSFLDFDSYRDDEPTKKKFEGFEKSFDVNGFTGLSSPVNPPFPISNYLDGPAQTIVTAIPDFPYSLYPFGEDFTFDNLSDMNFYETEWNVYHTDSSWELLSGRISLEDSKNYPIILPYEGTYSTELILHSCDGSFSRKYVTNAISVKLYNGDFISWKRFMPTDYNTNLYLTNQIQSIREFVDFPKPLLIESMASIVEHPLPPNENLEMLNCSFESFDSIEYYQSNPKVFPITERRANMTPYKIENLYNCYIEDLYHIWVECCDNILVSNEYLNIPDNGILLGSQLYTKINIFDSGLPIELVVDENAAYLYVGVTNTYIVAKDTRKVFYFDFGLLLVTKTHYKIDYIDLGDVSLLTQLERMLLLIQNSSSLSEDSFVFYDYVITLEFRENSFVYDPFIKFVSKTYSYDKKHWFKTDGTIYRNFVYGLDNFGSIGDIQASFDIYYIDPININKIKIGENLPYLPTSSNLINLANELNNSNIEGINRYSYNLVYDVSNNPMKIIAVCKSHTSNDLEFISYEGMIGSCVSRYLYTNVKTYEARIIKYSDIHPIGSLLHFNCENSKMVGKTKFVWKIKKESNTPLETYEIVVENSMMSFLFNEEGDFTISCEIFDTNNNKNEIVKKNFIKILRSVDIKKIKDNIWQ